MQTYSFVRLGSLLILKSLWIHLAQAQPSVEYGVSRTIRIAAPAFKPIAGVEGTPYVPTDTTERGWLIMGSKRISVKLHYNAFTGEVEYVDGKQTLAAPNGVNEFVILAPDTLRFKRGFPAVANWTADSFYELLYDGRKAKLLKHITASVKANTEVMANDYGKKQYVKREEYFVWKSGGKSPAEQYVEQLADGVMQSAASTRKALVELFPQEAKQIDQYWTDKKAKLKSWKDFIEVLRYLDTY